MKRLYIDLSFNFALIQVGRTYYGDKMDWKYWHYIAQLQRAVGKVHEIFVISSLFHDTDLRHLCPYTQFYVKRTDSGYALIDLYYPQIDFAIEIDEYHHEKNIQIDNIRKEIVSKNLNCEFLRISLAKGNILEQIISLKQRMKEKSDNYSEGNKFIPWKETRVLDISDLKSELNNTIFVRIIGEVHPDELYDRETGSWRLDEHRRVKIEQVVVVYNRMITRVFRNLKWSRSTTDPKKWRFDATAVEHSELVGARINGWKSRPSFTYSSDC